METITKAATTYTPPATAVVHETSVSFTDRQVPPPVYIVQYDKTLPVLSVSLYSGGTTYTVPSGAAVNVRLRKPDGTVVYNPALGVNASRTVAYISITQQMTTCAGDVEPVIEITSGGSIVNGSPISMTIDPNPVTEDAVESTDEFKTVQELLQDAQTAAQAAATSATTATQKANAAAASANTASTAATNASTSASTATSKAAAAATSATNAATSATTATQKAAAAAASASAAAESAEAAEEAAALAQQVSQGAVGYYETPAALRAAHAAAQAGNWAILGSTDTIWVWDTATNTWVDSHQKTDLSDYYTKSQTDEKIAVGNAASATKLATARAIDGVNFNGTADITHYGSCSTAAGTAAKAVAVTGFKLVTGAQVTVKFTVTNTASNPTLNVNSTGAKAIYYRGAAIAKGYLVANHTYDFRYNGTQYELVGDIDTNTTYSGMTGATASAAGAAGLVPAPAAGAQGKYLRGDGTWGLPTPSDIGAASEGSLSSIRAGLKYVDAWCIGYKINGGGFMIPIVTNADLNIKSVKVFNGQWVDCAFSYRQRVAGTVYVFLTLPQSLQLVNGVSYLVAMTFDTE